MQLIAKITNIRILTNKKVNTMVTEKILTKSWNNWLTVGLGLPTLVYVIVFFSTSILSDFMGFIGLFILGAVY